MNFKKCVVCGIAFKKKVFESFIVYIYSGECEYGSALA